MVLSASSPPPSELVRLPPPAFTHILSSPTIRSSTTRTYSRQLTLQTSSSLPQTPCSFASAPSQMMAKVTDVVTDVRKSLQRDIRTARPMDWKTTLMLLMVPFVYAARSIGYSWAVSGVDPFLDSDIVMDDSDFVSGSIRVRFSPLGPLVVSQLGLAVFTLFVLAVQHGWPATKMLFSRRYASLLVTGTLAGTSFCLQNIALTHVAPTTLTVLMSTQSVTAGIFQVLFLRDFPSKSQWASLFAGLFLAAEYTLCRVDGNAGSVDVIGVCCGLAAASCLALAGLAFQYFVGQFTRDAEDIGAEVKRLIIANEVCKVPISLGILLCTDYQRVTDTGFFYGWDWRVGFGASFLSFCMVGYRLFAISVCGALVTTVAASAEVAIVCFADTFLLRTAQPSLSDMFTLGSLVLVIVAFNLARQELQEAKTMTLLNMSSQLDRIDEGVKQVSSIRSYSMRSKVDHDSNTHGVDDRRGMSNHAQLPPTGTAVSDSIDTSCGSGETCGTSETA